MVEVSMIRLPIPRLLVVTLVIFSTPVPVLAGSITEYDGTANRPIGLGVTPGAPIPGTPYVVSEPPAPDFTPSPPPDFSKPAGDIGNGLGHLIDKLFAKDPDQTAQAPAGKPVPGAMPIEVGADAPNPDAIAGSICGQGGAHAQMMQRSGDQILYECVR
jgi:hypothetical protein